MSIWLVLRASTVSGVMIAALVFGIFLQQCAFVGHDTAHNGITHGGTHATHARTYHATTFVVARRHIHCWCCQTFLCPVIL